MADEPNQVHLGGRLQDGSSMPEEELKKAGLWRYPRGRSPSPRDEGRGGIEEKARKIGIGQVRPPKK
jgi:hypothetical protein